MLIFLRQQNGALLVEILYFLAGSVMHHSGVVNNTIGAFLSARVVKRVGLAGNHSIHTGRNTSGGTRHLGFITIKNVSLALTNRRIRRFFYSEFRFFMVRCGGPFSYLRFTQRVLNLNTSHKRHRRVPLTGCFITGRWWPFFIYRRKKYV